MGDRSPDTSPSLTDLPNDALVAYGDEIGVALDPHTPRGEMLRLIRARQELLLELDRDAMVDIVVWARRPVRQSASKEALARHIAGVTKARFDGLSDRGLITLARLRGLDLPPDTPRPTIEMRLRRSCGLAERLRRGRRALVGTVIARVLAHADDAGDYQFLPDEPDGPGIKERIEDAGVVGGLAQKLRGAADVYVEEKLNEIERRIDRKLDEIDQRLGEWRDREIANRIRLVRITLITTIIVAFISLGYHYIKQSAIP
ncbi:MAG: hypothetical protein ACE5E6_03020 [Phycisphaerae bacterium]